jgi:hyperosmotically inducible protein
MTLMQRHIARVLSTTAAAFALVACGQADEGRTMGQQVDEAIANTQNAAQRVGEAIDATMEQAKEVASGAADQAAIAAADAAITTQVKAALAADAQLQALQIEVDTEAGRVTLSGPAPDEAARERATQLAQAVNGVVAVDNRLQVGN